MASGGVPLAMFRGVNPVHSLPKSLRVAARDREGAVQGELLELPGRDDGAVRSGSAGPSLARVVGRRASRARHASRCSSRRWTACSTRARRPMCSSAVAKGDPAAASRYPVADYRTWLISRFPGGATALGAALPRGIATPGSPLQSTAAPRERVAAAARCTPHRSKDSRATSTSSCIRRRCSATGAAPTSRGCRSCPIRSRKIAGSRGSRFTRAPRRDSALRTAITSRSTRPPDRSPRRRTSTSAFRPDVVAIATGRGHTAYGRYAQNIGVNPLDALPVAHDARRRARAHVGQGARLEDRRAARRSSRTEGSARQHGRGIGQAVTRRRAERAGARRRNTLPATTSTSSCPDFGRRSPTTRRAS